MLAPARDLAGRIDLCCSVPATGGRGRAFYEIFPNSNAHLIFRFSASACRLVMLGPVREKATVEIDLESDYFIVRFRTGQAPVLEDICPSDLLDHHIDLTKIRGWHIDSLADRLNSLPDPRGRQAVMEDLIRDCRPLIRDERCRRAAMLLEAHGGRLRVGELADRAGIHVRSLERIFRDQLGMSPKRLARLIRLRLVLDSILNDNYTSLSDLALAGGYTDQSHMIRDFKALTGRLPSGTDPGGVRPIQGSPQTRIVHRYRR